jgi:hypothetical protein
MKASHYLTPVVLRQTAAPGKIPGLLTDENTMARVLIQVAALAETELA